MVLGNRALDNLSLEGMAADQLLLIDVGNTRVKCLSAAGVMSGDDAAAVVHEKQFSSVFADLLVNLPKPELVWVSNVAGDLARQALLEACQERWSLVPNFVEVTRDTAVLHNAYQRLPELGVDRWVAAHGARQLQSGLLLVIGCGTAITVDVVSDSDEFMGGAILPGLELAAQSLSQTAGIPLFEIHEYNNVIGQTTADCVRIGVMNACAGGVEKIVAHLCERFDTNEINIIASGGAAPTVLSGTNLKVMYDANLVLRGLLQMANSTVVPSGNKGE